MGIILNNPEKQNSSVEFKSKFINNGDYTKFITVPCPWYGVDKAMQEMLTSGKLINLYDMANDMGIEYYPMLRYIKDNYTGKYIFCELASKTGNIKRK